MVLRQESSAVGCFDELIVSEVRNNSMLEEVRGVYSGNKANLEVICRSDHITIELRIGCISADMPSLLELAATYNPIGKYTIIMLHLAQISEKIVADCQPRQGPVFKA